MTPTRRVVITGIGAVAPNGIGRQDFWHGLITARSGIAPASFLDHTCHRNYVAGEVRQFDPLIYMSPNLARSAGRFTQLALAATILAVRDAKLPDALGDTYPQTTISCGTSANGSMDLAENTFKSFLRNSGQVSPSIPLEIPAHAATAHISQTLRTTGAISTLATGCATGLDVAASGIDHILTGRTPLAIVAATEAPLSPFIFRLFDAAGLIARWTGPPHTASRPYDQLRTGLVLSEAAGALVLEEIEHARDRGQPIYAEILGYGTASEAGLPSIPSPYPTALGFAVKTALRTARLTPVDIDYINAHGNSTKTDDAADTTAYKQILGRRAYSIPISSIKSTIGQPFSAAGLLQIIATALALFTQTLPPTAHLDHPDPDCDLDYVPNHARPARLHAALVHAHSLGGLVPGSHSALVLTRHPRS